MASTASRWSPQPVSTAQCILSPFTSTSSSSALHLAPGATSLTSSLLALCRQTSGRLCHILQLELTITETMTTTNTTAAAVGRPPTHKVTKTKTPCTAAPAAAGQTAATTGNSNSTRRMTSILRASQVNEPVKCSPMTEHCPALVRFCPSTCHCAESEGTTLTPRLIEQCRLCGPHEGEEAERPSSSDCLPLARPPSTTSNTCTGRFSRPDAQSTSPSRPSSNRQRWRLPSSALTSSATSSLFVTLLLLFSAMLHTADSCSSRSTPKPRPPTPTTRPNITFQTYACPEAYAKWYCLNGATCFSVKIGESILYNCECADGYMGQRCEFKDLDGSYLPSREKILVETAGIAGGVTLAILLVAVLSISYYTYVRSHQRAQSSAPLLGQRSPALAYRDLGHDNGAFHYASNLKQHHQLLLPPKLKAYGTYGATLTPDRSVGQSSGPPATMASSPHCIACLNTRSQPSLAALGQPTDAATATAAHRWDLEQSQRHQFTANFC